MDKFDVVIIGAGASGSFLAMNLSDNLKVAVIDSNDYYAKKLLVTGNGKCNITNKNLSSEFYNVNLDSYFNKFNSENAIDFFRSIGVEIYSDEMGRCYPISNSAKSVVVAINNKISQKNITFFKNSYVNSVNNGNNVFKISFNDKQITSKNLVVCCGANYFKIQNNFENFNDIKLSPSLCALKTKEQTKALDGVRASNVKVVATCNDKTVSELGEVLFKDNGLSGICIFNLSSLFARNYNFDGKVIVDLLPDYSKEDLFKILKNDIKNFNNVFDMLSCLLHPNVANEILKRNSIQKDSLTLNLSDKLIENIINTIKNLEYKICGYYDNNQVFSGGISLQNLTENLENKKINNLYYLGEVIDVDAICGGYNLQWAWTSAKIVADNINNK